MKHGSWRSRLYMALVLLLMYLPIVVTAVFVVREVRKLRRMRKAEGNRKPGRLAEAEPAVATLP